MHYSIKGFNSILNRSVHNQDALWKDYRHCITSIIKSNIKSSDSIIIFGAGMCYDFDLSSLLESCEQVTLVDVDEKALESGLERHGIPFDCDSIKLIHADVTGLENVNFINRFFHLVKNYAPINEVKSFLQSHLSDLQIPNEFKSLLEQHDAVITMPIYTQLLFTQISSMLRDLGIRYNLSLDYTQNIQQVTLEFMPKIIRYYNHLLQSVCRKSGLIIAFSDLIEAHPDDEIMIRIKGILNNDDAMNHFLSEYINQYGYGLGTYGMMHLKESVDFLKQHYLVWPFTEARQLLVSGIVGNKEVI